ncbi:hypothetical protein DFJ77DRAFT_543623 [Powellomyces hirtus]|nr:hypothetical protein DFJ77DRAFT_543623 [Powellomyces hirtus]
MKKRSPRIWSLWTTAVALLATAAQAQQPPTAEVRTFSQPGYDAYHSGQVPYKFDISSPGATAQALSVSSVLKPTSPLNWLISAAPVVDSTGAIWYAVSTPTKLQEPTKVQFKLVKMALNTTVATNVSLDIISEISVPGTYNFGEQRAVFLGIAESATEGVQVASLIWVSRNATASAINAAFVYLAPTRPRVETLSFPVRTQMDFSPIVDDAQGMIYLLAGAPAPCILRYDLTQRTPTQECKPIGVAPIVELVLALSPTTPSNPDAQQFYLVGNEIAFSLTWSTLPSPDSTPPSNVSTPALSLRTFPGWPATAFAVSTRSISAFNTSTVTPLGWNLTWKNKLEEGSNDTSVVGAPGREIIGANVQRGWIYACVNMSAAPDNERLYTGNLAAFLNTTGAVPWTLNNTAGLLPCSNQTVLTATDGNSFMVSTAQGVTMYALTDRAADASRNATVLVDTVYDWKYPPPVRALALVELPSIAPSTPALMSPVLVGMPDSSVYALIGDSVIALPSASRAAVTPSNDPNSTIEDDSNNTKIVPVIILGVILLILLLLLLFLLLRKLWHKRHNNNTIKHSSIDAAELGTSQATLAGTDSPTMPTTTNESRSLPRVTPYGNPVSVTEEEAKQRRMQARRPSLLEEIDEELYGFAGGVQSALSPIEETKSVADTKSISEVTDEKDVSDAGESSSTLNGSPLPVADGVRSSTPLEDVMEPRPVTPLEDVMEPRPVEAPAAFDPSPLGPITTSEPTPSPSSPTRSTTPIPPTRHTLTSTPPSSSDDEALLSTSASTYHTAYSGAPSSSSSITGTSPHSANTFYTLRNRSQTTVSDDDERWSMDDRNVFENASEENVNVLWTRTSGDGDNLATLPATTTTATAPTASSPTQPIPVPFGAKNQLLSRKRNFPSHSLRPSLDESEKYYSAGSQ